MTQKRDLKRRVRERQARTGESYMTALRHVRGEDPTPSPEPSSQRSADAISVLELVDVSDIAEALGLTCRATVMPRLIERIDPRELLSQLRGVLRTTAGDPAFAVMRSAVLLGEGPSIAARQYHAAPGPSSVEDGVRFAARLRAGVGGLSRDGRTLAFSIAGLDELVVFHLWLMPAPHDVRPPALIITVPGELTHHLRFQMEVSLRP